MKKTRKNLKQYKNNNLGFSLIEVLIAMIILAVVAIPLMRSLRLTQMINARTRNAGQARILAENLMEGIKPLSENDVLGQFGISKSGTVVETENSDEDGVIVDPLQRDIVASDPNSIRFLSENTKGSNFEAKSIATNDESLHVFALRDIVQNGVSYDAKITMDLKENADIAAISTMSNYVEGLDYMFELKASDDEAVYERISSVQSADVLLNKFYKAEPAKYADYMSEIKTTEGMEKYIKENTKRKFVINIVDQGSFIEVWTEVSYELDTDQDHVYGTDVSDSSHAIFYKDNGEQTLRNVFFLYTPNYSFNTYNLYNDIVLDDIVINNKNSVPVTVNIIKQKTNGATAKDELNYKTRVTVNEGANRFATVLRTNLNENIYSNSEVNELLFVFYDYKSEGAETITGDEKKIKEKGCNIGKLTDKVGEENVYLYKTKVQIYQSGAYDDDFETKNPLLEMTN